jgi:sodium-dependent dicarboxylate transporter 2/3/5
VLLPVAWWYISRSVRDARAPDIEVVGEWQPAEVRVLVVFGLTAAAWIFRAQPFGGWSGLLGANTASDSTVALAAVVAMFLVPSGRGGALLDWPTAARIPWGLLLLFGGGIAISAGFKASGLAAALGDALGQVASLPLFAVVGIICLSVTFLTEVTSNTATTNLLMPILAAAAAAASLEPKLLMVPATLSASCAFMLPVATAPNAIVAGTPHITTRIMAREGLALNLLGALLITVVCLLVL